MRHFRALLIVLVLSTGIVSAFINTPTLDFPTANKTNVDTNPVLWWNTIVESPATTYVQRNADVQVCADSSCATVVWESFTSINHGWAVEVSTDWGSFLRTPESTNGKLQAATDYWWQVALSSESDGGITYSPFSTARKFTTRTWSATTNKNWYVRTDGSTANCSGHVDAADPGSGGLPRPCAYSAVKDAINATVAGDTVHIGVGVFSESSATISNNQIQIVGSGLGTAVGSCTGGSPTATCWKTNATTPNTSQWSNWTGDDGYLHSLYIVGVDASNTSASNTKFTMGNADGLVVEDVVFANSMSFQDVTTGASDGNGIILRRSHIAGPHTTPPTSGRSADAIQLGRTDHFAIIHTEIEGFHNITSGNPSNGNDELFLVYSSWHGAKNHSLDLRGALIKTVLQYNQWYGNGTASTFVEGVRIVGDTVDCPQYIDIEHNSGTGPMHLRLENCRTAQPASYYDIQYIAIDGNAFNLDPGSQSDTIVVAADGYPVGAVQTGARITATTRVFADYNDHYPNRVSGKGFVMWDDVTYSTATAFNNGSTQPRTTLGPNNSSADPKFTTTSGNFSLQSTSPAIDTANPARHVPTGGGSFADKGAVELITGVTVPTLTINDQTVAESVGAITFTVTMSASTAVDVMITYTSTDVTASNPNDYYLTASASPAATFNITIPAGSTTGTINVTVVDDTLNELTETAQINLTAASNATISDAIGLLTITDNDAVAAPPSQFNGIGIGGATIGRNLVWTTDSLTAWVNISHRIPDPTAPWSPSTTIPRPCTPTSNQRNLLCSLPVPDKQQQWRLQCCNSLGCTNWVEEPLVTCDFPGGLDCPCSTFPTAGACV